MNIKNKLIKAIENSTDEKMLEHIYTNILGNTDILYRKYHEWFENKTEKEQDLEIFVLLHEDLFADMCFDKGSITGDYMIRDNAYKQFENDLSLDAEYFRFIVDNIQEFDGTTHRHDRKVIVKDEFCTNEPIILHEMIHAHECVLNQHNAILKDILLIELYRDLKSKISELDNYIYNHANIPHNLELANKFGEHDLLFFLKSLDLDLKCGYVLGTIFGYGYKEYLSKIKNMCSSKDS